MKKIAVIIGDSFPNTLGLIWSLGEANIPIILVLVAEIDGIQVLKSKYLKGNTVYKVSTIDDVMPILNKIKGLEGEKIIICTNDKAAEYVDSHEEYLCQYFTTPCRGNHMIKYFNKAAQCSLASECGLNVPRSIVFKSGDNISNVKLKYPILIKPLQSTKGMKADIHICNSIDDLVSALNYNTKCQEFLIQEFIVKEYELNVQGVSCNNGIYYACAIKKIRHYPHITGAASFAKVEEYTHFGINIDGISKFVKRIGYYGPFSCELLHKDDENYFMEINIRNDGLGYAATKAGVNLPSLMFSESFNYQKPINDIYMMWLCLDLQNYRQKTIDLFTFINDIKRSNCFIDYNRNDLTPFIYQKILDRIIRLYKRFIKI